MPTLLAEPRCKTFIGSHAFHASAPKEWDHLLLKFTSYLQKAIQG